MTHGRFQAQRMREAGIVGMTIVDTFTDPAGEFWGFEVAVAGVQRRYVWVNCDPEGNGPGALEIERPAEGSDRLSIKEGTP